MAMLTVKQRGDFANSETLLKRIFRIDFAHRLERFGVKGVEALYNATPYDTGETARSWRYEITRTKERVEISWVNDYKPYGVSVAILIQNGHMSRGGTWVEGVDYINPALAPIFDEIEEQLWREVTGK